MKQLHLPYQIVRPPKALRRARLDNIALVPAYTWPESSDQVYSQDILFEEVTSGNAGDANAACMH